MSWTSDDFPWYVTLLICGLMYWKWVVAVLLAIVTGCWFLL